MEGARPNRYIKALEFHHKAVMLRSRAAITADATSRATLQMLATYWEDKAKQAENEWLPEEPHTAERRG
jgi:hypothetical protein